MADKARILMVEDEEKIAEAVCSYLQSKGYPTLHAADAAQALALLEREAVGLVLLDLMLPDLPGEEVCRRLRARSAVPIIMLTARVAEDDQVRGLGLGADDYITKPFSLRTLHARVEAVLRRAGESASPGVLRFGGLTITPEHRAARLEDRPLELTPNEYRLLLTLAKRPDKVFTREELIAVALGEEYDGFDRTVDSHIKNLRRKLGDDSRRPRFILTVHGVGYRFGGGE